MTFEIDQIGRLVTVAARANPHAVAFKDWRGRWRTYGLLESRANQLANALLGLGLTRGDRVAAWLPDSIEYLELYVAVAKAGLVLVPVNARYTPEEVAYIVDHSEARVVVFDTGSAVEAAEVLVGRDVVAAVVVGRGGGPARPFEDLILGGADVVPPAPDEDDVLMIGYTSGTTGRPKGAMLTHRSIKNIARMNALSYRQPRHGVCVYSGSMAFVATIAAWVGTFLWLGGTIVLMGPWDADELLPTVGRERGTFVYVPSPLLAQVTELIEHDGSSVGTLDCILHSASKVPGEQLQRLATATDGRLVEGLGMTEHSGGLVTATTRQDMIGPCDAADVYSSVGRPAVDCEVRLLGTDGTEVPADGSSVGELYFRTPALMDGYWKDPDATASAFQDDWWRSGDLATMDPAGYIYIVERRNDLIVSGGMNVYPAEVERVIADIAGVVEAKVVGAPHERWGQTVVACVVKSGGAELSEEDIISYCRQRLAAYKKPTRVVFLAELPRSAAQKVRTGELRRMIEHLGA